MKKLLSIGLVLLICLSFAACGIGNSDGVECENFRFYSKDDNTVYGYPVCPECGHVGAMLSARISPGEDAASTEMCEKCYEMYRSYVKRID